MLKTLKTVLKPAMLVLVGINIPIFMFALQAGSSELAFLSAASAAMCLVGYGNLSINLEKE